MLRCDICTGSATRNIDLRGDFGQTAQLVNGFAESFFWLDNEGKKKGNE